MIKKKKERHAVADINNTGPVSEKKKMIIVGDVQHSHDPCLLHTAKERKEKLIKKTLLLSSGLQSTVYV